MILDTKLAETERYRLIYEASNTEITALNTAVTNAGETVDEAAVARKANRDLWTVETKETTNALIAYKNVDTEIAGNSGYGYTSTADSKCLEADVIDTKSGLASLTACKAECNAKAAWTLTSGDVATNGTGNCYGIQWDLD